jgi:CheY-like chemotaxis protein
MSEKLQDEKILSNLSIVYVEDDELIREMVVKSLKRRIETIYEAGNGKEGLALIWQHKPTVVITDIEMPIMDGITMIKELRKKDKDLPIIILVITAYKDEEHYTNLADAYIYKPIKIKVIIDTILKLIEQKSVQ